MASATITSKGQVTIPKEVRDRLGLKKGDRLSFNVEPDGSVRVSPESGDLLALYGVLHPKIKGISVEAMNEVIRRKAGK